MTGAVKLVAADVLADCPFSIAQNYAEAFLRQAQAASGDFAIRVPIGFMPAAVRHRVTMTFALQSDVAERGRGHDEIGVRWKAGTSLLPDFSGTVRFRIAGGGTLVRVEGSYSVPFGVVGELFDDLAGARVAHASAMDFAEQLGTYLERRQRAWRSEVLDGLLVK
jgi:hypothetical protein